MPLLPNPSPATLAARERRARQRQARIEAGWRDGRFRDPSTAPVPPYLAVQRWRLAHRDTARLMDRVYKGMKRSKLFQSAWPQILAYYGGACLCCGSTERVAPDHVLPVRADPVARNILANLQPLCRRCNTWKRDRVEDKRPDAGAWIVATFGDDASKPLHPTGKRARYGHTWTLVVPHTDDTSTV